MKIITVLGMGYIGLPTALLLAKAGHIVFGFDIDKKKIDLLEKGKLPFEERGLKKLFGEVKKKKTFFPTAKLVQSDFFVIAVPTPNKNGDANLSYVDSAINLIGTALKDDDFVVLESTVGPLDCEKRIIPRINKLRKKYSFAHCPERALPGNTLYEMINNARIIGTKTPREARAVKNLYKSFSKGKIHLTDTTTAALCKVMENTYRDVNIALANEFAKIAQDVGFDVWEAIELANKHPRVDILQPGPGVGGHCIPIDPWFLAAVSRRASLITNIRRINDLMPSFVAISVGKLIIKHGLKNPTIAILGYAYKKNVDDTRETPSEKVANILAKNFEVLVTDPHVESSERKIIKLRQAMKRAVVVVLLTDHDLYKRIGFSDHKNISFVFDTRNLFDAKNFKNSKATLYKLGTDLK